MTARPPASRVAPIATNPLAAVHRAPAPDVLAVVEPPAPDEDDADALGEPIVDVNVSI